MPLSSIDSDSVLKIGASVIRTPNIINRRVLNVALPLACIRMAILCFVAPWKQVHPADPILVRSLGYALLWSRKFAHIPDAQVDSNQLFIYTVLVQAVSVVAGICALGPLGPTLPRKSLYRRRERLTCEPHRIHEAQRGGIGRRGRA
jgi:hypothetical protein